MYMNHPLLSILRTTTLIVGFAVVQSGCMAINYYAAEQAKAAGRGQLLRSTMMTMVATYTNLLVGFAEIELGIVYVSLLTNLIIDSLIGGVLAVQGIHIVIARTRGSATLLVTGIVSIPFGFLLLAIGILLH